MIAVDLVLPVLDEAAAIPWVLARVPAGVRPIVVDNGSSDGSAAIASALGVLVIEEPRPGFGSACWAGLQATTADVVAFMDCDRSHDPGDLPAVVRPVLEGRADLVLGARRYARAAAAPAHARLANRYLARAVRRRYGIALRDLGSMRAARRQALLDLALVDRRSGWPLEMVLRAGAAGWRVEEVEVRCDARVGKSKVTGSVLGTARAVRDMSHQLATHPRGGTS